MAALRKKYKKQRDESVKDSDEYVLNDSRQASVKVIMNTTYG
jgi:DNA polymerase elongation subunit (family B)